MKLGSSSCRIVSGKPLHLINGKPMLRWCNTSTKSSADEVIVTTPDDEIIDVLNYSLYTNKRHERCLDRVGEAAVVNRAPMILSFACK